VTDSWLLKIDRAEEHLREFKRVLGPIDERRAYPVSKGIEADGEGWQIVARLHLPQPDNPVLPVIAGDIMFNVRSALDHLAQATIPPAARTFWIVRRCQFPIFTCDVDERDPLTGEYLHRKDRGRWDRMTQGITHDALAVIKWKQPYNFHTQGRDPRDSPMAILSELQNADKHRKLTVLGRGLTDPAVGYTLPNGVATQLPQDPLPEGAMLPDGAVVERCPPDDPTAHMKMHVEGTVNVAIAEGPEGPFRGCPRIFELMIRDAFDCAEKLEPFVKV
jgi:hypothetical protein